MNAACAHAEGTDEHVPSAAILVVDDRPHVLDLCRTHLERDGHRVICSSGAQEALEILGEKPMDILLADHAMPNITGSELLQKAAQISPKTVRILFSGVVDMRIAEEAFSKARAYSFLAKPFSGDQLRRVVREALVYKASTDSSLSLSLVKGSRVGAIESLLQTLPTGVIAVSKNGLISEVNAAVSTIFGRTKDQILGFPMGKIGLSCKTCSSSLLKRDRGARPNHEQEIVDGNGLRRTLLLSCEKLKAAEEDSRACVACVVDITDQKALEKMVLRSKQELEAVFDSITDPTAVVDRTFKIVRANQAFADFVDMPFNDLLGKHCAAAANEFLGSAGEHCLEMVFDEGKPHYDEFISQSKKVYKAYFFPIYEGTVVANAVARFQDVTIEKDLEHQLLQSEKMASIGQLAAGIAHEINNPVGFIQSNMNRLDEYGKTLAAFGEKFQKIIRSVQAGDMDPLTAWNDHAEAWTQADLDYVLGDVAAIASESKEGTERIRRIVADLRAFSHPDAAEYEYADLNEGINTTLNIIWNELKYNCEIVKELSELPLVYCKRQQLNQVVMNLLVNAHQALSEFGTIYIRSKCENDTVAISIADTGVGIPKENISKVFDPFFTTKDVGKGTGLGLHIVAGIVKNHGGEIRVESSPGQGSTFIVSLPVHPRERIQK